MDYIQILVWGMVVFTLMGLFFGVALAATAKKFYVPINPLIEEVRNELPSANCGACGFAGCQAYAEALVNTPEIEPSRCTPGGKNIAQIIGDLTQKPVGEVKEVIALLRCHGTRDYAKDQAQYEGIRTCSAAVLTFGGPKACKNGCLGLGDCERVCPFDAIFVRDHGIVEVIPEKCTGCGLCVAACPKQIIELYPRTHRIELACVALDKASVVRPTCLIGCTICRKCIPACPAGALTWTGRTILIDHTLCNAYGPSCQEACVVACPTFIIHRVGQAPKPEPPTPSGETNT